MAAVTSSGTIGKSRRVIILIWITCVKMRACLETGKIVNPVMEPAIKKQKIGTTASTKSSNKLPGL